VVFLAVSAALVALLLWLVSAVLLPFLLAVIIAYLLAPLVVRCERAKMPRPLSILLVYAVTFSIIYGFGAAVAPRIYIETAKFAGDAPRMTRDLIVQWGPRFEKWMQNVLDHGPARPAPEPKLPAVAVVPQPDGSYALELRAGVELVRESDSHWRILPANPEPPGKFSVAKLAGESVDRFVNYIKLNALELIRFGQRLVSSVARAIFLLFMTLMMAGYILHTRESILRFFRSLPPATARVGFDRLISRIDRGLAGVVRGQLVICLINGVLSAIGFWMFGLKYWPVLSLLAAVMSIIPIFGSILSSVPVVLIGLTQSFWIALWVLVWIIGIHQIEANVLNPKIIGMAAKIHPVLVIFALVVGEHFFGLWGALLGVPTLSVAQSIFNHFRFASLPDAGPDSMVPRPKPAASSG
jgi:predicted PurR-regulated permease PerM